MHLADTDVLRDLRLRLTREESQVENPPFTFSGRLRSIRFACRGIRTMLVSQHNAWVHACATIAAPGRLAQRPFAATDFGTGYVVLARRSE